MSPQAPQATPVTTGNIPRNIEYVSKRDRLGAKDTAEAPQVNPKDVQTESPEAPKADPIADFIRQRELEIYGPDGRPKLAKAEKLSDGRSVTLRPEVNDKGLYTPTERDIRNRKDTIVNAQKGIKRDTYLRAVEAVAQNRRVSAIWLKNTLRLKSEKDAKTILKKMVEDKIIAPRSRSISHEVIIPKEAPSAP